MRLLKNLFINAILAFVIGCATSFAGTQIGIDINPLVISGGIFTANIIVDTVQTFTGSSWHLLGKLSMAVQVEIWQKDIIDNLYKDNSFLNYATNEDQYVLAGKVVHIPVSGASPTVVKNRSSVPATVSNRTDTEITYVLEEFTTDPILISNAETVELSYDKRRDATGDHFDAITDTAADDILIKWASSAGGATITAHVIPTTGADVQAHMPSATGNRKKLMKEELLKAKTYMDRGKIPAKDRYALIDPDMMEQLLSDPDLKSRALIQEMSLQEGKVNKLYGFILLERSTVLTYNNAGTPVVKALGAAAAATDNGAVFCWQKSCVGKATGVVKFFEKKDDPTFYGDIYSALLRAGGRNRRAAGVVSIVQAAGS